MQFGAIVGIDTATTEIIYLDAFLLLIAYLHLSQLFLTATMPNLAQKPIPT